MLKHAKLDQARRLISEAIADMDGNRVRSEPFQLLCAISDDIEELVITMAEEIKTSESERCAECCYAQRCVNREPYGDRTVDRVTLDCTAPRTIDCPAVQAAGFTESKKEDKS